MDESPPYRLDVDGLRDDESGSDTPQGCQTGRPWIGMHFSWNVMQSAVFGFANSGTAGKASILKTNLVDNLLTGGNFGPEGSILLVALSFIAVVIILVWKKATKQTGLVNQDIIDNDS